MALLYKQSGNRSRAMELFRDSLHAAPNDVELHYTVAEYALRLGDPATAKSALDIVLTLEPGHADARSLRTTID